MNEMNDFERCSSNINPDLLSLAQTNLSLETRISAFPENLFGKVP